MRFRDGRLPQQAMFFALVGLYLLTAALTYLTFQGRLGEPNIGINGSPAGYPYIAPEGREAIDAGVCYGSKLLAINGNPMPESGADELNEYDAAFDAAGVSRTIGETNSYLIDSPYDDPAAGPFTVKVAVTPLTWGDVACVIASPFALTLVFVLVGVAAFLGRPWEPTSWAKLQYCVIFSSFLLTAFSGQSYEEGWAHSYSSVLSSLFVMTPLTLALAFPNIHPLVQRHPKLIWTVYLGAVPLLFLHLIPGHMRWINLVLPPLMLGTLLVATLRLAIAAVAGIDRLVRQRGRILLLGVTVGFGPPTVFWLLQSVWHVGRVDLKMVLWSSLAFPLALAYAVIKTELVDTGIVVRRSIIYAAVVAFDTALAIGLIWVISGIVEAQNPELVRYVVPAAFAIVVVSIVVFWPRMDAWLQNRLYPKRARLPELMAELGSEMALCTSIAELADVLAHAPSRIGDSKSGVVFFFADAEAGVAACSAAAGPVAPVDMAALEREPLIQLMRATRKEIRREGLCMDPQIVNIRDDCLQTMDRLGADVLMPIVRNSRVIGGMAIGPRASGDVYDKAELDALVMLMQQALQSIMRIQAFAELEAQRGEMAALKQVFPPHIVDRVMAEGGVKSFRGQRKMVTVFFSDLRGFTTFSDTVEPEEVMATLHEYHRAMGLRIKEFGGTLERYTGDGMMVFFNDPVEQPDHVQRATRMAIAMRKDVAQLRESWIRKGYHLDVGMGIHAGYATVGFIGYEGRPDYGVIGNVTNMAARLCDHAGGGEILVTTRVVSELGTAYATEPAGEMSLKGFRESQLVHRVLGAKATV